MHQLSGLLVFMPRKGLFLGVVSSGGRELARDGMVYWVVRVGLSLAFLFSHKAFGHFLYTLVYINAPFPNPFKMLCSFTYQKRKKKGKELDFIGDNHPF